MKATDRLTPMRFNSRSKLFSFLRIIPTISENCFRDALDPVLLAAEFLGAELKFTALRDEAENDRKSVLEVTKWFVSP